MRALSIRQPYAELILRGVKTVEYRSRPTRIVGERLWIYASLRLAALAQDGPKKRVVAADGEPASGGIWSRDLAGEVPPPWIAELANAMKLFGDGRELPVGVIVGSAVIERVTRRDEDDGMYEWHLGGVERAKAPLRKPKGHPQPVWFRPF